MASRDINLDGYVTSIYISGSGFLFPAYSVFPSPDLYPEDVELLPAKIVYGSMKLDEMLADDSSSLQFGRLCANKFEVELYDIDRDITGKYMIVTQRINDVESYVFNGYIESCTQNKDGYDRKVIAYDNAYVYGSKNVAPWWTSFWQTRSSATLKQCRESLLDSLNLEYEDVELPNDNISVIKNVDFTSISFSEMLRMICELNCCIPHFNRLGILEFIMLNTDPTPEEVVDLTDLYEGDNSDFKDFRTADITGIQFYDSSDQLKYTIADNSNPYPVQKNILVYDKSTSELETIGNTMLNYLQDLTFVPSVVKMIVGSFNYNLGDFVHTEKGDFFILENEYTGPQFTEETISASADEHMYEGTPHFNMGEVLLNERYSRVSQTVEDFLVEYGDFKNETQSSLRINSEAIETEVTRAQLAEQTIFANYSGSYIPTLSNAPANSWTTTNLKEAHVNNTFFNTNNKKYYVWTRQGASPNYSYNWVMNNTMGYDILSSQIKQNADSISLKVSRGTLSSEISAESGQIKIESNRLIVNSTNFKLTNTGNVSATGATLVGGSLTIKGGTNNSVELCKINTDGSLTIKNTNNKVIFKTSSAGTIWDSANSSMSTEGKIVANNATLNNAEIKGGSLYQENTLNNERRYINLVNGNIHGGFIYGNNQKSKNTIYLAYRINTSHGAEEQITLESPGVCFAGDNLYVRHGVSGPVRQGANVDAVIGINYHREAFYDLYGDYHEFYALNYSDDPDYSPVDIRDAVHGIICANDAG